MLILYTKTGCPYCEKVKDSFLGKMSSYEERNISLNEEWGKELIEKGGKKQVPFLVDTSANVMMYESEDILDYLNEGVF